jgi:hypothetical protein
MAVNLPVSRTTTMPEFGGRRGNDFLPRATKGPVLSKDNDSVKKNHKRHGATILALEMFTIFGGKPNGFMASSYRTFLLRNLILSGR